MNPIETDITSIINRLKSVNSEINSLKNEKELLENSIHKYFNDNDISEFNDCKIGYTTTMNKIPFPLFQLKQGVDPEKCKITIPISWVEQFSKVDSNGKEIDTSQIQISILAEYKEKYPELIKISKNIKIKGDNKND